MTTQLTTAAAFKEYLNISVATDDSLIDRLVVAASELVKQYLNRDLGSQSYTDEYDGSGKQRQVLRYWPVTAVASVLIDGVAQAAATSITSNGYRFDDYSVIMNNRVFNSGLQNVQITYTAGFASVPGDVEQAALEIIASLYRRRTRTDETTKAMGQGGSTSYSQAEIPATAKEILSSYMRQSPI